MPSDCPHLGCNFTVDHSQIINLLCCIIVLHCKLLCFVFVQNFDSVHRDHMLILNLAEMSCVVIVQLLLFSCRVDVARDSDVEDLLHCCSFCWCVAFCSSMNKSKSKKATRSSKMTAAWVDDVTITISDDDDDEADTAADNQEETHRAAESTHSDADQSSTAPEKSEAAEHLDVEESDVRAVCTNEDASEPVSAMDTEPSMEIPVNSEKSLEMPPGEGTVSRSPTQLPSDEPYNTAVSSVDNASCELMDKDDENCEAELPRCDSVDVNMASLLADSAVLDEGSILNSRSSDDRNECSAVEQGHATENG